MDKPNVDFNLAEKVYEEVISTNTQLFEGETFRLDQKLSEIQQRPVRKAGEQPTTTMSDSTTRRTPTAVGVRTHACLSRN